MALAVPSLDGYPYGLASVFSLHDFLLQAVEPDAGVEHLADLSVLAYEDATLGVFGSVAGMNANTLELGHSEQDGEQNISSREFLKKAEFINIEQWLKEKEEQPDPEPEP